MKWTVKTAVLTSALVISGGAYAAQGEHDHGRDGNAEQKPAAGMMMSHDMQEMRATMHQMQQTSNPNERMAMMKKHREQMHAMMKKMHGDGGMMNGCMQQMQNMQQMMGQMMGHVQAQQQALDELSNNRRPGPPGKRH